MANDRRVTFALILILVSEATHVVGGEWKPADCIQGCMPFCMKVQGATELACNSGCALGCEQLQGKGGSFHLDVT